jgi:hypothetical protein
VEVGLEQARNARERRPRAAARDYRLSPRGAFFEYVVRWSSNRVGVLYSPVRTPMAASKVVNHPKPLIIFICLKIRGAHNFRAFVE